MNRNILVRCRLLAAVLALSALPSVAAEKSEIAPIDRRIDLDLVDAAARDVLSTFASILGADLALDPALDAGAVTIRLHNVRAGTALDAVCESLDASWTLGTSGDNGRRGLRLEIRPTSQQPTGKPRPPLADRLEEQISLDLKDASMEQVLSTFAHILDAELDMDPGLTGRTLTIHLTGIAVRQALDTVLGAGWTWRLDEGARSRHLVVRPTAGGGTPR